MKVLQVKNSWFSDSDLRLDASYHLSDGPIAKARLKTSPYSLTTLKNECDKIFSGAIFKRTYVNSYKYGWPYLTGSDMVKADINSGKYISKKSTKQAEELRIQKDWILISCSGTLGNCVFTNSDFEGRIGTHDLIRVIPNEKSVKKGYLYAYLASKYGYGLLIQSSYGGVVKHIEPHHIENIPIPILPEAQQQEINNLITKATDLRVEANGLLKVSIEKFYDGINLAQEHLEALNKPLEREISNSYKISMNELSANTFRGRNYSPRKQRIINVLKTGEHNNLRDVLSVDPFYGARYKRIESHSLNSVELLSQGDIFDLKPKGRSIATRSIKNLHQEIVSKGTILIPAQGTLGENEIFGRAKFVWGYLEKKVIAGHAMRFIPDERRIQPGYLFAVLSSSLWFRMLRNTVYGTNLLGFIVPLINDLPIPRIGNVKESEIDQLVKDAYEMLTIANEYEYRAIEFVENEIESWQKS
ncbi:Type I restriction modification DNA specificity domain-containing protein [Dyadobacter soli]|uniref:Type I restriction modification DNA specificity domain-containing protein n=1 Tax=Dyadobacter soli TaxID=659014 RepID=A0A1G6Y5G8_9BACT|nr:restriction endonuclease subunit S [Dyadobacter soli]SDD85734.1 Type I restriction modification DNA specificity domain-containing protein [Dyadobacter soli]